MPVPSSLVDVSTTASSNSPAGSEARSTSDDYHRNTQAMLKGAIAKGADVASASSLALPASGNYFAITGTTTISGISSTNSWDGRRVTLHFNGALSLTHSASFDLGGYSLSTAAGTELDFVQVSSGNWRRVKAIGENALNLMVFDPSIDNTGATDVSAKLQAAVTASAGRGLYIPNGTYLVDSTIVKVSSNTTIRGESHAAILKTGTNVVLYDPLGGDTPNGYWSLTNLDWSGGNSNITVQNLGFVAPIASNKGACHFRTCINLHLLNCRFDYGGPSATACTNYSVEGNYCYDCINAGLDNWDGCSFGVLDANHVLGNGNTTYGILITGVTTDGTTSSPCSHMKLTNNEIKNVTDLGIWIQGAKGAVRDSTVTGNSIDTVTAFHGIRVSDSERIDCSHNRLKNLRNNGITLQTEGIASSLLGLTQDCTFMGNTVQDSNAAAAAGVNAIENHAGKRNTYIGNKVLGTLHKYAFSVTAGGDSNRISENTFTAGVTGSISDSGTNTTGTNSVVSFRATDNSGTSYGAGPTNVSWSGESYDTASAFTSPSFTAKRPGKHAFKWGFTHTNGVTGGDRWDIKLVATGITVVQTYLVQSANFNTVTGGTDIDMASGDTAKITITRSAGSGNFILHGDPTFNYFTGFFIHD